MDSWTTLGVKNSLSCLDATAVAWLTPSGFLESIVAPRHGLAHIGVGRRSDLGRPGVT
jgi:hypothetical protein